MAVTLEQFVRNIVASGLMSADEVAAFQAELAKPAADTKTLAQQLVRQNKLTKYQATAIYQGKTGHLVFGEYVVLDEIGQGGMGRVLKAHHRRMDRTVAIKVLSNRLMQDAAAQARFYREVQAAAKLIHPNIVTAFDASEYKGLHYLVMEYVDGEDLATILYNNGRLSVEQAVECMIQAARGLQYAHERGIVHRDIKPGNLLLCRMDALVRPKKNDALVRPDRKMDAHVRPKIKTSDEGVQPTGSAPRSMSDEGVQPTIKILDMGLARFAVDEADDPQATGPQQLTESGQIMGTVDYMAPEQAEDTRAADHQADIYSLGCTLFRLLTAQPMYDRDTVMRKLLAHREDAIPSLLDYRVDVGARLNGVFQRMVAKHPDDRYQSMNEVITALQTAMLPATQAARPAAPKEPKESSSAMALSEFFGHVRGTQTKTQPQTGKTVEETIDHRADAEDTDSGLAIVEPLDDDSDASQSDATPVAAVSSPASFWRRQNPVIWFITGGAGLTVVLLLILLFAPNRKPPEPTNRNLAGEVEIVAKPEHDASGIGVTPGAMISSSSSETQSEQTVDDPLSDVNLWMPRVLVGHTGPVTALAFSADGHWIASAGKDNASVKLWDLKTGSLIWSRSEHSQRVLSLAFSPDGKVLASGSLDHSIRRCNAATGELIDTLKGHTGGIPSVQFSSDGATLASGGGKDDKTIMLWNTASGQSENELPGQLADVLSITFSPDGQLLTSGNADFSVRLCNVKTRADLWNNRHDGGVYDVTFSPDANLVASASADKTIRIWTVASGKEVTCLRGHTDWVRKIRFLPDGNTLVSVSIDGTVRFWDLKTNAEFFQLPIPQTPRYAPIALSHDGRQLALAGWENDHRIRLGRLPEIPPVNYALEFDGQSSYVETPVKYDGSHPITVEANVKLETNAHDCWVLSNNDKTGGIGLATGHDLDENRKEWRWLVTPGKTYAAQSDSSVSIRSTIHIAGVFDGTNVRLYLNGIRQPISGNPEKIHISDLPIVIGAEAADVFERLRENLRRHFEGTIDEIRISKTVRYTDDFTPPKPYERFEPDEHTVALYHCEEIQDGKLIDASGNGRHGTVHNCKLVRFADIEPPLHMPYEPAPLEEWLAGREILTVKQDGTAMFTKIQAALDALKPGQVVEVLDRGPYAENLKLDAAPNDTGLISRVQTVLRAPAAPYFFAPSKNYFFVHSIQTLGDFRIHGIDVLDDPRIGQPALDRGYGLLGTFCSGDLVVDQCDFLSLIPDTMEHMKSVLGIMPAQSQRPIEGKIVCVRNSCFRGRVGLHGNLSQHVLILKNFFDRYTGHVLVLTTSSPRVVILNNVFDNRADAISVDPSSLASNLLYIGRNTFLAYPASVGVTSFVPSAAFHFQQNLTRGYVALANADEAERIAARESWQFWSNVYARQIREHDKSIPPSNHDHILLDLKLDLAPDSPTYGRVVDFPPSVETVLRDAGAVSPGPAPAEGDWFTRLRERWRYVLEESSKSSEGNEP